MVCGNCCLQATCFSNSGMCKRDHSAKLYKTMTRATGWSKQICCCFVAVALLTACAQVQRQLLPWQDIAQRRNGHNKVSVQLEQMAEPGVTSCARCHVKQSQGP